MPSKIRVNVLGSWIEKTTLAEFLSRCKTAANAAGEPAFIITANSLMVLEAETNLRLKQAFRFASMVVPESSGICLAMKFLTGIRTERLPGIDLLVHLLDSLSASGGAKVFLLGSEDEVVAACAETLEKVFVNIRVVGINSGFFGREEEKAVIDRINDSLPDLLFVGMGMPKQEIWISSNLGRLKVPVIMVVGGSFDVLSGRLCRAPQFFQDFGIEWLYRIIREPWRFRRIMKLPVFVYRVMRQKLSSDPDKLINIEYQNNWEKT